MFSYGKNVAWRQKKFVISLGFRKLFFLLSTAEVEDTKETAELLAAKQAMTKALEVRRSELEDKLYDKVQELKKLCLQEAVRFTL